MNINFSGQVQAASAAGAYFKGQELSNEESSESKDKKRALRQKLIAHKATSDVNKTTKPDGKNYLA